MRYAGGKLFSDVNAKVLMRSASLESCMLVLHVNSNLVCFYFSVLSVHLTSAKSLVGIAGVVAEIQEEKKVGW